MTSLNYFVSFDVESTSLHGEGFAVGAVAVRHGVEVDTFLQWAFPAAELDPWVAENVMPIFLKGDALPTARELLLVLFAGFWRRHRDAGAVLVADCPWPVESRFLARAVDHGRLEPMGGPYPLIDVASVRLAVGLDPLATCERRPDELPVHNPLADARQSARLLLEALQLGRRD